MSDEPGSQSSLPIAKQALAQKRNVRDLNTRLEMFVRAQAEKTRAINQLKESLARQEMDYKSKLTQQRVQFQDNVEKLRKENQNLAYENKCTQQEFTNALTSKAEFEERLLKSEEKNAALSSENSNIRTDLSRTQQEFDDMRKAFATMKYKYDSYEAERCSFESRMAKQKSKTEQLLKELTQKEATLKTEKATFERLIVEKNEEIEHFTEAVKKLELENSTTQSRLRQEFDNKLAEFVQKREEQYKQEKDEWMRIFKEEFNRKLRSFKEANQELSHSNIKQSEEIQDLRARISKLKQQKTELEVTNRNNEEEIEKLRNDLDDLRRTKDAEIKLKNSLIIQERDRFKAKELQFDELAGMKLQLDAEIELYRNILNEAERDCGYNSPMVMKTNTGTRNSRKRKRMNNYNMTPIFRKIITPGVSRAAKIAQKDLKAFESDGDHEDQDMKEQESESFDTYETPSGIEGGALQFSGLDLNKGMIEIQNMGEEPVSLDGFALTNQSGSMIYDLPTDMELQAKNTLRIYVGEALFKDMCGSSESEKDQQRRSRKFIGDYDGAYVFWGNDVWTGTDTDCARLYNPSQEEIARIEISPDMIDGVDKKNNCLMM
eukprot:CAMPEP_0197081440 /NCGR_PEP_ID=MMETSP1384-20130603/214635_1 /TAXON_ID=29189 /ORGANISM="Ammonia sp." /LENGTH=603 /DNA_ID=CAMNT_0042520335 /DNA_START=132 /DNA_END=1944 /DNA_ORIENTATION=-